MPKGRHGRKGKRKGPRGPPPPLFPSVRLSDSITSIERILEGYPATPDSSEDDEPWRGRALGGPRSVLLGRSLLLGGAELWGPAEEGQEEEMETDLEEFPSDPPPGSTPGDTEMEELESFPDPYPTADLSGESEMEVELEGATAPLPQTLTCGLQGEDATAETLRDQVRALEEVARVLRHTKPRARRGQRAAQARQVAIPRPPTPPTPPPEVVTQASAGARIRSASWSGQPETPGPPVSVPPPPSSLPPVPEGRRAQMANGLRGPESSGPVPPPPAPVPRATERRRAPPASEPGRPEPSGPIPPSPAYAPRVPAGGTRGAWGKPPVPIPAPQPLSPGGWPIGLGGFPPFIPVTVPVTVNRLTSSLLAVAFLSSFGSSMLFGYNLAVVNHPAQYIKDFFNLTILERYGTAISTESLTVLYSITVSIFAIGGLVGSFTVGILVTKFGRRGTLVKSTALVFAGSGLMGFSRVCGVPEMIIIGRFITGIHSGIALSVVPMYLGEIAPKNLRGFLGLVPSIFICIGVFLAQILGLQEILGEEQHWPLFLSLIAVPTFIQLMLLPWFPESPRYLLIEKRNIHATVAALKLYRGKANNQEEVEEMQEEQCSLSSMQSVSVCQLLRDRTVRRQVLTVAVINMGMQLSGIDAIWFYTNFIFENAGIQASQVQYTTVGTGAIEVIAGLVGCFTIEKIGRKPLMIGGFGFMGMCCAGITLSLILQAHVPFMHYVSVACVVGIIAGFCIGPAGVPFLMTGELFMQSHRPAAYIIGGALNWLSNFTVGFVFPFLQMSAGAFCYLIFFGVCEGVAVYIYFIVPETKNKTFVEISQMFASTTGLEYGALGADTQLSLKQVNGYGSMEKGHVETQEDIYTWSDEETDDRD